MYCLSIYLIQIQSYRAFSNMAVDHWCLSLISLIPLELLDTNGMTLTEFHLYHSISIHSITYHHFSFFFRIKRFIYIIICKTL